MTSSNGKIPDWLRAGRLLAHPTTGEDLVISGLSGCYPESNDVYEFRDNLKAKADMVTDDTRRWDSVHPEIPKRAGKIWNVEKCDAGFLGIHPRQCDSVDPLCRILLEKAYECLFDAGINPKELEGTNTGVYVGACASESEKYWLYDNIKKDAYGITGCHRSMLATRISYALKLQGPAFVMDTACSSSFFAFEHAYGAIRKGLCDRAIVAGANLCLHPYVTLQFSRLGVLSMDGACKCFDEAANGYTRSEAISAILLQKSQEAKRIYCSVVHCKVNSDGYKMQGITYPSGDTQMALIREVYDECQIDPSQISFMEAHGTGTIVGDPEELKAIESIFLPNRTEPLLIGSVKSNIGHSEPTSGLCSITKVILSMEGGKILPNMNYKTPRKGVESLESGKLVVVTENVDWPDQRGLVAINSFGFGGANCHTLVQSHKKSKNVTTFEKFPVLALANGRTMAGVHKILNNAKLHFKDPEFIRLLHELTRFEIQNFNCRGYSILTKGGVVKSATSLIPIKKKALHVFLGGSDPRWYQIATSYLRGFEIFTSSIYSIHKTLLKDGLNLLDIFDHFQKSNQMHVALLTMSCQIATFDMLKSLNVEVDQISGESLGEITCAYLDGNITLSDAVLSAKSLVQDSGGVIEQLDSQKNPWINLKHDQQNNNIENSNKKKGTETTSKKVCQFAMLAEATVKKGQNTILFTGDMLDSLGQLYLQGFNFDLHKLYPPVSWPVSRGTPMISPLIKWNHSKNWFVSQFRAQDIIKTGYILTIISLKDDYWKYLSGHIIDGRNLFPATAYLTLVWEVLGMITGKMTNNMKIMFENVRFLRATTIPNMGRLNWSVMVHRGTGYFEVIDGDMAIVCGVIKELLDDHVLEASNLAEPLVEEHTMDQKDIYTEIKMRGYQYKGTFKGLADIDVSARSGNVKWTGNWVTYLDAMMQMQILQIDSRLLYVPTGIKQLVIDPKVHLDSADANGLIPIYAHQELNLIRSGGVEMRGLNANSINKRKVPSPVLEKYIFVPNETSVTYSMEEIVRIALQVAFENLELTKLKIVEILGDLTTRWSVGSLIKDILEDFPLIESDVRVFTSENIDLPRIQVEDKHIGQESDVFLVAGHDLDSNAFNTIKSSLKSGGYVLNILPNDLSKDVSGYTRLVDHLSLHQTSVTLYRMDKTIGDSHYVPVNDELTFIDEVKTNKNCCLYANNTKNGASGLLGLTNCLRKETSTAQTRCVLILDDQVEFDQNSDLFKSQLKKNMAINVLKGKQWGTYRHLPVDLDQKVMTKHCYANTTRIGDLSSLSWLQGPIVPEEHKNLVRVHYGSINFRDVMTASGRVSVDVISKNRLEQECVQGLEFAGFDNEGRRVVGMLNTGALASVVIPDADMCFEIPQNWSMEEAVTVPAVYCTVLFAFFTRAGGLMKGQSVLIHSGSGGIGQAAITVALHFGCNVFTTVGSKEKKDFLMKKFPRLKRDHIGNSRDSSFENLVMKLTNHQGVDFVLNSLAEEKLQASVRCLANHGHFLEIGKFDLASDNQLNYEITNRSISFHGIMLDDLFRQCSSVKKQLINLLQDCIKGGCVQPLNRTCFKMHQLEEAYRYMASGQHIGKIVLQIRDERASKNQFPAVPRFYCPNNKSCLVVGGLGGFGLELCDWLVLRGCRQLFITSRNGIKTGYQQLRVRTWESYGVNVNIIRETMTTQESCSKVLSQAPHLHAIFNLAVVLKDNLFANQSSETFRDVLDAKANTTQFLDQFTRANCENLKHFVIFSSVSCGRGNIGQTNYGMANSIMERICEQRVDDGYPALVIQWGSIADVGLAAEMLDENHERPIGGTLPQKISDCLEVLDRFMCQNEHCIVSSMVVAEKKGGTGSSDNVVDAVVNILGIRDLKTVSHHSTLPELGMDSMMAVEIKQTLERDFEVFLAPQQIRSLTFAQLSDIQENKGMEVVKQDYKVDPNKHLKILIRQLEDEEVSRSIAVNLKCLGDQMSRKAFLLPGIEGFAGVMESLASKLQLQTIGLQFSFNDPKNTLQESAAECLEHMSPKEGFCIIAYSFGCTIAVELVIKLEQLGHKGTLILIDGSYDMALQIVQNRSNYTRGEAELQTSILCNIATVYVPTLTTPAFRETVLKMSNFEERVNYIVSKIPTTRLGNDTIRNVFVSIYKRMKAVLAYEPTKHAIKSNVFLFKPTLQSVTGLVDDYGLSHFTEKPVDVRLFEGNHYNILESDEVALEINKISLS